MKREKDIWKYSMNSAKSDSETRMHSKQGYYLVCMKQKMLIVIFSSYEYNHKKGFDTVVLQHLLNPDKHGVTALKRLE